MSDNCCSSSTARLTAHIGGLILEKGSFSSEEESNSHNHHHHGCVVALDIRQEGALKDLEELASWHSNSNRDLMVNDVSDEEEDDHEENVHNIIDHSRRQQQQHQPQQQQQQQQQQRPIRPRMPPKAFNASVAMPRDNDQWKPRQSTRKSNKKRQQQKQSSSKNLSPPRSMLQKAGSLLFGNSKRNSQYDTAASTSTSCITKDAETVRKEWQRQNLLMAAGQFESSTTMMSMSTSSWGSNRRSAAGRR